MHETARAAVALNTAVVVQIMENSHYWSTLQMRSTAMLEAYRPWDAVGPVFSGLLAFLVQYMYAMRSYKMFERSLHKSIFVTVVGIGMIVSLGGSLMEGTLSFMSSAGKIAQAKPLTIQMASAIWLWASAFVDVVNSGTLCVLLRNRVAGFNSNTDGVIKELIRLNWSPSFSSLFLTSFAIVLASLAVRLEHRFTGLPHSRALCSMSQQPLKNVVVVGGSYVGLATATELIKTLLATGYRVVVVEKNSHFGHLFAFPRFALTTPGLYEHKAFIPYTSTLPLPHCVVRAAAVAVNVRSLTLDRPVQLAGPVEITELNFEALVLATGTKLSPPGTLPGETKKEGIEWFQAHQERVAKARRIVIVGGGAVGVQMACDIPLLFPSAGKEVTLVHSRMHLMPRFHHGLHDIVAKRFADLGVKLRLGSRAIVPEGGWKAVQDGGVIILENGDKVEGDLIIFSTGQTPLSDTLKNTASSAISSSGFVKVKPTFQLDGAPGFERVFAVGDIADSGAPKAARPGAVQAGVVARNIARLVEGKTDELETYTPDPAAIHLTLGLAESIIFRNPPSADSQDPVTTFIGEPSVTWKTDGEEDMGIEGVWARRAPGITDHHL
ncbi:hypothetical protein RQP46_009434 [Phenoliferia psychrophenolica]